MLKETWTGKAPGMDPYRVTCHGLCKFTPEREVCAFEGFFKLLQSGCKESNGKSVSPQIITQESKIKRYRLVVTDA